MLLRCVMNWVAKGGNNSLLLSGKIGTGKTALGICALMHKISVDNIDAMYISALQLLDLLKTGFSDNTSNDILDRVKTVPLLMLDEMGSIEDKNKGGWKDGIFQSIIEHRHSEELQTIFTTNLTVSELKQSIGVRPTSRIQEMVGLWHYYSNGIDLRERI